MKKFFSLLFFLLSFTFLCAQNNSESRIVSATYQKDFTLVIKSVSDLIPPRTKEYSCYLKIYKGDDYLGKTAVINEDDLPHLNEEFAVKNFDAGSITIIAYRYLGEYYHDYFIGKAIIEEPVNGRYEIQDIATNIENNNVGTIVKGYVEVEFK